MDSLLPSELMAKVAGYLSVKETNSMRLVSKTAYRKLEGHRKWLPRTKTTLKISYNRFVKKIDVETISKKHAWTATLSCPEGKGDGNEAKVTEEGVENVVNFYNSKDKFQKDRECRMGLVDGLSQYIQFILSRAEVRKIWLDCLLDEHLIEVINQVKSHRLSVPKLKIQSFRIGQSHLDLISRCNARSLCLSTADELPADFYGLPEIKKLSSLSVSSYGETFSDRNLLDSSSKSLEIRGKSQVTVDGFTAFLTSWLESSRVIDFVCLSVSSSIWEQDWAQMLGGLPVDVVDVGLLSIKNRGRVYSCLLRRLKDDVRVSIGWSEGYIYLKRRK